MCNLDAKLLHLERNIYYVGLGEDGCHLHDGSNKLINLVVDAGRNVSTVASIPFPWYATLAVWGLIEFMVLVSSFTTECLGSA